MKIDQNTENPLLKNLMRVIPPTTIRLPSKGLLYKNNEIDDEVVDGQIIIYPMTTLDEIIIRSPDMLLQGTAIDKVVARCAPQIKKPLELFSKDIDYILIYLRKISYGNDLIIRYNCPICRAKLKEGEELEEHEYKISIDHFLSKSKELADNYADNYTIVVSNGQVIHLRPSKFSEMLKMFEINEQTTDPIEMQKIVNTSILSVVQDVDGISDKVMISEWLDALPIKLMGEIISKIAEANNFGPTFDYKITCIDCNIIQDISYILNPVSFFTLPSSPTTSNV